MTSPATRQDVDVDLTKQVPCTAIGGCDRTAQWLQTVSHRRGQACRTRPICGPCKARCQAFATAFPKDLVCFVHEQPSTVTWRPI